MVLYLQSEINYSIKFGINIKLVISETLKYQRNMFNTREGQKFLATIFFLFTWVHLYKGGSIYIKYNPLSFMPCNMNSVARLVALRH